MRACFEIPLPSRKMKVASGQCALFTLIGLARKFALAWLLALAPAVTAYASFEFVGDVRATTLHARAAEFRLDQGAIARVELVAPDTVRVRLNPLGQFSARSSGAVVASSAQSFDVTIHDTAAATYLFTERLIVIAGKSPFGVVVLRADGSLVCADIERGVGWDTVSGLIVDQKFAPPDERYFGAGLRGGPIDRRGRVFVMKNVDWGGYGEFTDPLYSTTPFFYGLRGGAAYGLFLDGPALPFFDFDSRGLGLLLFGSFGGELDYYLMAGPEPAGVARAYARLTGTPPLPPLWALGYHQSRFGYASQTELLDLAATFRQLQIPCDALYLDLDYMDNLQLFTWNSARFPDPVAMNRQLDQAGFKTVNIVDPVALRADRLWPTLAGQRFFLADHAGAPLVNSIFYGDVSWIDFTNPGAGQWYKEALKTFLQTGVGAVWNDLNEPAQNFMPEAIYSFGGEQRTDLEARNLYALRETALSYAAQLELRPQTRPWVLSRAGYSGIQRYAANWSGDTLSSFDSLRVCVQTSLSMGLSGQNQFGHDIGGFLGAPSAELFIRWLEFGSFTTLFRTHSINTSPPREPWRFGEPYTSLARNIINERYRLLPYIYTLFESAAQSGDPALAPTVFYFPADARTYAQDREFMLGPHLLVAPVVAEGAVTRTVYLPGGDWIERATDRVFTGGQEVTVAAPLGQTPVFVRAGAIIPSAEVVQSTSAPSAPHLNLDIYPKQHGPGSQTRQDKGEERRLNPPNGSWGIVKVQPTPTDELFLNPPNGSWGIVKVQPFPYGNGRLRLDLNHPPTAVGGIWRQASAWRRLDLNDPPTAVGGIRGIVQPYPEAPDSRYRIPRPTPRPNPRLGPDAVFTLYEDDGVSYAFRRGQFRRTRLSYTIKAAGALFVAERAGGELNSPARAWRLRFHQAAAPSSVEVNGAPIERAADEAEIERCGGGWFYNKADKKLTVRITEGRAPLRVFMRG